MDPLVLGLAGLVGSLLALTAATPTLRRRVARSRMKQLQQNGLVVVDDPIEIAWGLAAPMPGTPPLCARIQHGHVVVTAGGTWTVVRTRFLTARRHLLERRHEQRAAGGLIGQLRDVDGRPVGGILPTSALLSGEPHNHVWREIEMPGRPLGASLDACFLSGGPRAALDALAADAPVCAALGAFVLAGGELTATREHLVLRVPRSADLQESQVRRCLDVAAGAVAALEAVAARLPDLEVPGASVVDDVAVSSDGSPFAVRSIDR